MVINRFLILLSSLTTVIIFTSCNRQVNDKPHAIENSYRVMLADEFVTQVISNFADSSRLDPKKTVISVNVKTDTYRTMIYIRHSSTHFEKYSRFPSHYTFVNGYLVLLYTDLNRFIKNELILDELMSVLDENDLDLIIEETVDDTPTWKVTKCENNISVINEAEEVELPCFLKLGVKDEQIVIEEENWFKELKKSRMPD